MSSYEDILWLVCFVLPLQIMLRGVLYFIIEEQQLRLTGAENSSRNAHFFWYLVKNDCLATVGNEKNNFRIAQRVKILSKY
jgi:hypothetical protein